VAAPSKPLGTDAEGPRTRRPRGHPRLPTHRLRRPRGRPRLHARRLRDPLAIAAGALLLRLLAGVGFANYDTLYALVWGQQLARGQTPQYGIPIASTPHPLIEALGLVLTPLGARATEDIAVALGFLALSACGWAVYRLGALWFNRAAGALAAAILLTRVPILSYGVRAYVDVPYLLLVLGALIVETRRRRAGAPVLALLALAGLLRPEAWVFSALYWLYLVYPHRAALARVLRGRYDGGRGAPDDARGTADSAGAVRELAWLALLAASAPLLWIASDWLITGNPLWSLTNTRHTAHTLGRETGIAKVPEYIPRRIGEILAPPALAGAALGGVLSLLWLRRRALLGAVAGVLAVLVLAAFASAGLPIDTRYAFLAAGVLCVFCGAGLCGWTLLPRGDPRRRWWMAGAAVVALAFLAYIPAQYRTDHRQLDTLARQQRIQDSLLALVHDGAISARCEPIGVPNHAPIPLLALWLETPPANIVSAQARTITEGTYVDPADEEVQREYILDRSERGHPVSVPPGFTASHTSSDWLIFQHCA
jgi:hypothetical protein